MYVVADVLSLYFLFPYCTQFLDDLMYAHDWNDLLIFRVLKRKARRPAAPLEPCAVP
jgi:hypothetical protein